MWGNHITTADPTTTPANQESPESPKPPTTEPFRSLQEAFARCSINQHQQATTPTDPFATPPHRRSPSPPRLSPSPAVARREEDLIAFDPTAAPPSPRATSPFATLPETFSPAEHLVDSCVAHLVEMGYADSGVDGALERLRVYAEIAEGDLDQALGLIEEDERAISELTSMH